MSALTLTTGARSVRYLEKNPIDAWAGGKGTGKRTVFHLRRRPVRIDVLCSRPTCEPIFRSWYASWSSGDWPNYLQRPSVAPIQQADWYVE